MNSKKWIKIWFIITIIIMSIIAGFNYIIDPYDFYNNNYLNLEKSRIDNKIRLVKAIKIKELKPVSIVLGTSRADFGYNPNHKYFLQPAYNCAVSNASMYEEKLYFTQALKQKQLKRVLLVLDFRMLNMKTQKSVSDFDTYFNNQNIYKYLFSFDLLKNSFFTLFKIDPVMPHLKNGMRKPYFNMENTIRNGLYLKNFINDEKIYYKDYPKNNTYKDTSKKSFPDLEFIIRKCYENNITLDIIFGPSHIRQWEALNYYLGFDTWLKWKKDVVISVNQLAQKFYKKPFRIMDFSVYYDGLTNESIPTSPNVKMKYYRESSHYNVDMGNIVLDRLIDKSIYKDFGIGLNIDNIDKHLKQQKINRHEFIDTKEYKRNFEAYLNQGSNEKS